MPAIIIGMNSGKNNYWVLTLITALAIFVRFYGLDLNSGFSPEQKASIILSIFIGIFSVIGLYFLVKELFDEKLAGIASFLIAVSSWHVFISRLGTKDIFTSFALIFAVYFAWHGLKYGHTFDFFLAGLFGGAGFYAGRIYFAAPLLMIFLFLNYWDYVKKDFSLSKYEQTKTEVLGGFALLMLTTLAVALPVGFFVWQDPAFILSAGNSIFSDAKPLVSLWHNFSWVLDKIVLIKFGGVDANVISWPVSIFFAIGFIKELTHWLKRKHGHLSVVHTLIFSWLFVMLIPSLLSTDEPSTLGLSTILPMVMILVAKGIWWVIEKLNKWNHLTYPRQHKHWMGLDAGPFLALTALLISIAILEISKLI